MFKPKIRTLIKVNFLLNIIKTTYLLKSIKLKIMNKENIFKFISVIIIPILIIELLFNILYLFRDEINPIIRSLVFRVNSNSTVDAKINEMYRIR